MILETYPIALILLALLIPIIYCFKWKKESLKKVIFIFIIFIIIVLLYPITTILGNYIDSSFSYFIVKLMIFVVIPLLVIIYLEKWKIVDAFSELGVRGNNLIKSIILGIGVLVVTVCIYFWGVTGHVLSYHQIIMFFDAFNEEFLFRGVLLLYFWKITDIKVAYTTSILAFILAHPQHFLSSTMIGLLIGTAVQGILLAIVSHKTKNIIGPWISHGLNRIIPQLLRVLIL